MFKAVAQDRATRTSCRCRKLEDVADRVRKGRVLLIVSPDSKIPPEEVQKFFDGLSQKNNLCVLTGDKTAMGSVEKAARQLFAAQKADGRIPKGHPQREDLERKQQTYEQDFNSTILNLFDKVLFPIQRAGRPPQLASKALDMTRDATKPFNGEEQIEKTLTSNPLKLYLDVEKEFDAIRDKAQDLLGPRTRTKPAGPTSPTATPSRPACRGCRPRARHAQVHRLQPRPVGGPRQRLRHEEAQEEAHSAQVIAESEPDDEGRVRLRSTRRTRARRRGSTTPRTRPSPSRARSSRTSRIRRPRCASTSWCAIASGQYETGDPVTWSNKLVLRNHLSEKDGKRSVELFVAPRATIRYTLDGSEPREGTPYDGPDRDRRRRGAPARVSRRPTGSRPRADFRFPAKGKKGVQIDDVKPGAACLAHRAQARLARQDLRGAQAGR